MLLLAYTPAIVFIIGDISPVRPVSEAPDISKDPTADAVKDIPDPSALPSAPNSCQEEIAEVSANGVTDLYVPEVAVIIADPELPTTFLPTSAALKAAVVPVAAVTEEHQQRSSGNSSSQRRNQKQQ